MSEQDNEAFKAALKVFLDKWKNAGPDTSILMQGFSSGWIAHRDAAQPPGDGGLRAELQNCIDTGFMLDSDPATDGYLDALKDVVAWLDDSALGRPAETTTPAEEASAIIAGTEQARRRPAQTQGERITMTEAIQSAKQIRTDAERRRREANEREVAEDFPPAPDRVQVYADGNLISDVPSTPAPKRWRCKGCGWEPTDTQVRLLRTTVGDRHDHFTGKKWCGPVEPTGEGVET